jgi:hypothetical protein
MATHIKRASRDHWLARAGFGLAVAALVAGLLALYWTGPLDL